MYGSVLYKSLSLHNGLYEFRVKIETCLTMQLWYGDCLVVFVSCFSEYMVFVLRGSLKELWILVCLSRAHDSNFYSIDKRNLSRI